MLLINFIIKLLIVKVNNIKKYIWILKIIYYCGKIYKSICEKNFMIWIETITIENTYTIFLLILKIQLFLISNFLYISN